MQGRLGRAWWRTWWPWLLLWMPAAGYYDSGDRYSAVLVQRSALLVTSRPPKDASLLGQAQADGGDITAVQAVEVRYLTPHDDDGDPEHLPPAASRRRRRTPTREAALAVAGPHMALPALNTSVSTASASRGHRNQSYHLGASSLHSAGPAPIHTAVANRSVEVPGHFAASVPGVASWGEPEPTPKHAQAIHGVEVPGHFAASVPGVASWGESEHMPKHSQVLLQLKTRTRTQSMSSVSMIILFLALGVVIIAAVALCMTFDARFGPRQDHRGSKEEQGQRQQPQLPRPRQQQQQQSQHQLPSQHHLQSQHNLASQHQLPQQHQKLQDGPQPKLQRNAYGQQSAWETAASSRSLQRVPSLLPGSAAPGYGGMAGPSCSSLRPASLCPTKLPGPRFTFGGRNACLGGGGGGGGGGGSGGQSPATQAPASSVPASPMPTARRTELKMLCPCLVVPEGMELVFAVRDLLSGEKQQLSFSVVDLEGQPLSHVIVNEVGPHCGILIQMLDQTPLAWVRTKAVHDCRGMPEICYPSGEVFCTVAREEAVPTSRYTLRDTSGQRLYTFHGDFKEKAVNVVSPSGRLICDTERCELGSDGTPHFQVRVAPGIDAGLVLCGLLAVEKIEGVGGFSPTPRAVRPPVCSPRLLRAPVC